ncbi:MAG: hypothetical protein M9892_05690 [Bacteroidetes bacterium]|nr:hypothetical protein [Bacteroidota bacterium]
MTGCKYYCKLVSGFSNTNCKLFLGRDTYQTFVLGDSEVLRNPPERKARKRWRSFPIFPQENNFSC